jgi:hypothetical protein
MVALFWLLLGRDTDPICVFHAVSNHRFCYSTVILELQNSMALSHSCTAALQHLLGYLSSLGRQKDLRLPLRATTKVGRKDPKEKSRLSTRPCTAFAHKEKLLNIVSFSDNRDSIENSERTRKTKRPQAFDFGSPLGTHACNVSTLNSVRQLVQAHVW